MEETYAEQRPCATCGGTIASDDLTCATCGQVYIPEAEQRATEFPPLPVAGVPAAPAPLSNASRNWAMAAHLSALGGVVLGGIPAFLGPLVVWLLRRDAADGFATGHAREALNFNLSIIIYAVVGLVLTVFTLGLALLVLVPVAAVAFVVYLVVTVRAAMAAASGAAYRYPLTMRLVT